MNNSQRDGLRTIYCSESGDPEGELSFLWKYLLRSST